MDPQLEFFLQDAFKGVQPTSPKIGRVVVEPDYDVNPVAQEGEPLAGELVQCLREYSTDAAQLGARAGSEIRIPDRFRLLAKYVRRITLHETPKEEPWVEVAPPGNWI